MVQKQTVHGRMVQLSMANLDAILDAASDPEQCISELVEAYAHIIDVGEQLVVTKIGKLRLAEADHAEDVAAAIEWEHEVKTTRMLAHEAAAESETLNAHQLTAPATHATGKQASFQAWARQSASHIAAQSERVKELKTTLAVLKERLGNLKERATEISAVSHATSSDNSPARATSINVFDPTAELSRFRERVHSIRSTMG